MLARFLVLELTALAQQPSQHLCRIQLLAAQMRTKHEAPSRCRRIRAGPRDMGAMGYLFSSWPLAIIMPLSARCEMTRAAVKQLIPCSSWSHVFNKTVKPLPTSALTPTP